MIRVGRGLRRGLRRITRRLTRGLGSISKITSKLTKPLQSVVGKVLDKLPLPEAVKGFAKGVLSNPLALMGGGPLGAISSFAGAAGGAGGLLNVAQGVVGSVAGGNPQGLANVTEIIAHRQARFL